MHGKKIVILFAAIWALSLPAYLITKTILPQAPNPRVSPTGYMLFGIKRKHDELEFLTSYRDDAVCVVNMSFEDRSTAGVFRPWNTVRLPIQCRIDMIGYTELTRSQVRDALIADAHAMLLEPDPPPHYVDMRDFRLLEAVETNRPIYIADLPANMRLDLFALGWICGALLIEFLFLIRTPALFKQFRAHLRWKEGYCTSCGYPLADLPIQTCPECGTSTSVQQ